MQFPMEHVPNMWLSLKSEELIINSTKIKPTIRGSSINVSDYIFSVKGFLFISLRIQAKILTVAYSTFNSYGISFGSHSFPNLFCWLLILLLILLLYTGLLTTVPVFWLNLECY